MKFRKKPVVIEAEQFTEATRNKVFHFIQANTSPDWEGENPIIKVQTVHGDIAVVRLGDWVIKDAGVGNYYPCKPDIFQMTYEPVEAADDH